MDNQETLEPLGRQDTRGRHRKKTLN